MSIFTRVASAARHRGKTPRELRAEIDELTSQLRNRDKVIEELTCRAVAMATAINELSDERNRLEADLDKAAIDYSGALEDLKAAQQELPRLRAELANRDAVTVPPMERDTSDGADQATEPTGIDVRTLREADAAGLLSPVVRISDSGASADPGAVPVPAVREPAA